MGYRKVPTIYTLEFDGDLEGLIVRVKSIPFGKVRRLMATMDSGDENDQEAMEQVVKNLADSVVSWNLQDEVGIDVPVSQEAIEGLDFQDVMAILDKWMEIITGPSKELGKGSLSGGSFPGQPLTMETL